MNTPIHILIAEDDPHIRQGLADTLESEGYQVSAACDGEDALRLFAEAAPQLVLLDVMMPGLSGYDVCGQIRQENPRVPILMLTAKGEEIDKVVGLEKGADDYVTKPFGVHELLARIRALLRRAHADSAFPEESLPEEFVLGSSTVNRSRYELTRGKHTFPLSARELRLLEVFYLHPGEVLDRNRLLNDVWGIEYLGTTRTLDQHIAQLRKKIEEDPSAPCVILTVHGVGYRCQPAAGE